LLVDLAKFLAYILAMKMEEAYSLPDTFHADPADRIITATARLKDCTILAADKKILAYPHVKSVW